MWTNICKSEVKKKNPPSVIGQSVWGGSLYFPTNQLNWRSILFNISIWASTQLVSHAWSGASQHILTDSLFGGILLLRTWVSRSNCLCALEESCFLFCFNISDSDLNKKNDVVVVMIAWCYFFSHEISVLYWVCFVINVFFCIYYFWYVMFLSHCVLLSLDRVSTFELFVMPHWQILVIKHLNINTCSSQHHNTMLR